MRTKAKRRSASPPPPRPTRSAAVPGQSAGRLGPARTCSARDPVRLSLSVAAVTAGAASMRRRMVSQNDRILTSHAGSLPRPDDLIELNRRRIDEESYDETEFQQGLREATIGVVRRQAELGIDVPNDGEYGHAMGQKVDYGAWWHYSFSRLGGIGSWTDMSHVPIAPAKSTVQLGQFYERRDWNIFGEAYQDPDVRDCGCREVDEGRAQHRHDASHLRGACDLHGPGGDPAGHRQLQGGPRARRRRKRLHLLDRARERLANRQYATTRRTRSSSTPAPRPCARSTSRSRMRA